MTTLGFEPDYTESIDIRNLRKQVWDIVVTSNLETTKEVSCNVDYAVKGYDFWIAIKVLSHTRYDEVTEEDVDNCIEEDNLDVDFTLVFTYGRCSDDIIWGAYTENIIIITYDQLKEFIDKCKILNNVFDDLWDFVNNENEKVVIRKRNELEAIQLLEREKQKMKLLSQNKEFQKYIDFEPKIKQARINIYIFCHYINEHPILYKELSSMRKSRMMFMYYNIEEHKDAIEGIFYVEDNCLQINPIFLNAEYIGLSQDAYTMFEQLIELIQNRASIKEVKKVMTSRSVIGKLILITILSAIILFFLFR